MGNDKRDKVVNMLGWNTSQNPLKVIHGKESICKTLTTRCGDEAYNYNTIVVCEAVDDTFNLYELYFDDM